MTESEGVRSPTEFCRKKRLTHSLKIIRPYVFRGRRCRLWSWGVGGSRLGLSLNLGDTVVPLVIRLQSQELLHLVSRPSGPSLWKLKVWKFGVQGRVCRVYGVSSLLLSDTQYVGKLPRSKRPRSFEGEVFPNYPVLSGFNVSTVQGKSFRS